MNYPISFGRWRIRQEESENHQWVGEHWRRMWREGHQFREDLWWGYWERIWFARTAVLGFLPEEVQKNLYRYWITSLTPLIQIFFINELKCVNTDIGKGTLMYIIIHHYLIHLFPFWRGPRSAFFVIYFVPSKPFNVIVQFSHFSLICPLSLNSLKKKNLKTLTSSLNVTIAHILDMEGA